MKGLKFVVNVLVCAFAISLAWVLVVLLFSM